MRQSQKLVWVEVDSCCTRWIQHGKHISYKFLFANWILEEFSTISHVTVKEQLQKNGCMSGNLMYPSMLQVQKHKFVDFFYTDINTHTTIRSCLVGFMFHLTTSLQTAVRWSSALDNTLKIEVILSLLHDAGIQTSWISSNNMLQACHMRKTIATTCPYFKDTWKKKKKKKISYNLDGTCSKQFSTLHATVANLYKPFSVMELNKCTKSM